ncbi:HYC_CC_PP family protein [Chitinophaga dinghuensis]|nr:hypothetical protein [Chitinophaga dinghuensis]
MKKFFAILFAALYVALTSGFAVNVHYCMGKLAAVELQSAPADFCGKCRKPAKNMDCCKNEFKFCKVSESHHGAPAVQQDFTVAADLRLPVKVLPQPTIISLQKVITAIPHGPPDRPEVPIFLQNCTFLI